MAEPHAEDSMGGRASRGGETPGAAGAAGAGATRGEPPEGVEMLVGAPGRWRWAELVVLFGVAPAALAAVSMRAVIPLLVVGAVVVLVVLAWDRSFDRWALVRVRVGGRVGAEAPGALSDSKGALAREVGRIVAIWLAAVVLLTPAVALVTPERFLWLPREKPLVWVAIMLLYPLLSVYPQEVIFRAFFFHRYGRILGDSARLIAVNALAFGLAHAMFRNGIAVGMTTVGGALFAWTYWRTRSIPLVCLEHALYGCFVFTVGLGEYFYTGGVGRG